MRPALAAGAAVLALLLAALLAACGGSDEPAETASAEA